MGEPVEHVNSHPLPAQEFNAIFGRVPRLTVEVVVGTTDGVVLTRRSIEPCKGQWHLPGGTVRFGEPLRSAVVRVAEAELGVRVGVGSMLGYIEYPEMLRGGYRGWPVGIAFEAHLLSGELTGGDQSDEVACFRSVPADTILEQAEFLNRHTAAWAAGD